MEVDRERVAQPLQVGEAQAGEALRQPGACGGEAGELGVGGREDDDVAGGLAEIDRLLDVLRPRRDRAQEMHGRAAQAALEVERQARRHEDHLLGHGREPLVQPPGLVHEPARQRVHRHHAQPDLVRDQHGRAGQRLERLEQPVRLAAGSRSASSTLVSQSVRQSTSTARPAPAWRPSAGASSSGSSTSRQPAPRRCR